MVFGRRGTTADALWCRPCFFHQASILSTAATAVCNACRQCHSPRPTAATIGALRRRAIRADSRRRGFLCADARRLRLHYDWHQAEPLSSIIATLSLFECISLELQQDTLYVR